VNNHIIGYNERGIQMSKKSERDFVSELYTLIDQVPFAAVGGRQTTTIAGLANYENDMRKFIPMMKGLFLARLEMIAGMEGDDLTFGTVDECLSKLKVWIEDRQNAGWQ